jgi:hypothetical protein
VDDQRKSAATRAFSPYLRRPLRALEEVEHAQSHGHGDTGEEVHERLDNNLFRISGTR